MSDDKTSLKEVVAAYLRKNPDFLDEYPDILESMEINHQSGSAASLIERQVQQLRTSNEEKNKQLSRLIQVATENEKLMARLHHLTLELMSIQFSPGVFHPPGQQPAQRFQCRHSANMPFRPGNRFPGR